MSDKKGCGIAILSCIILVIAGYVIGYETGHRVGYIEACADYMKGVCQYELRKDDSTQETSWVWLQGKTVPVKKDNGAGENYGKP